MSLTALKPLDPADFLAAFDRSAVLYFEVQLHRIAEHAGGEAGQADTPDTAALVPQPGMGRGIKTITIKSGGKLSRR